MTVDGRPGEVDQFAAVLPRTLVEHREGAHAGEGAEVILEAVEGLESLDRRHSRQRPLRPRPPIPKPAIPMPLCSHVDQIRITALPSSVAGCENCLEIGSSWVHLRMCMTCGKIGCCDASPNRHASRHARDVGHPIIRSAEPGEDWSWCFVDELAFVVEPSGTAS